MTVVCCSIIENAQGLILAAQRSARMSLPLSWEFPGGKLEQGESEINCLQREIKEELNIEIKINRKLGEFIHHYSQFSITLIAFECTTADQEQEIRLSEHAQYRWIKLEQLGELDWSAADLPIVAALQAERQS